VVKNDAEVLGKVRRFVAELGRRESIVTLEAEQILVDAAKGREALGGAGSLLKEEEARRLASAEGAVSERATLRGPDGRALALEWQAARSKAGFIQIASQLKAEARALPRGVHVSLRLNHQRFVDGEHPGIADAELRTSLLIPPDRVALFELPSSDGKAVYLLLRAGASTP
jgi:hypothetical protein